MPDDTSEHRKGRRRSRPPGRPHDPPLALWLRVLLFLLGWILVLIGVAGLVLPGLQGVLTLIFGAAVLSLASEMAYKVLRLSLGWWPRGWRRVARFRRGVRRRLVRWGERDHRDRHDGPALPGDDRPDR